MFLFGQGVCAPLEQAIVAQTQESLSQQKTQGLKYFKYLRFYLPTHSVPQKPNFWQQLFGSSTDTAYERALAVYLFNMYTLTRAFHTAPTVLSLEYLGALDGLSIGKGPFPTQKALWFYNNHSPLLTVLLRSFMKKRDPAYSTPSPQEYVAWLNLLEKQPRHGTVPVYVFPTTHLFQATLPQALVLQGAAMLKTAYHQANHRVVLYDVAHVQLEDLDHKLGKYQTHRKLTYRWVKEECHFSTYLLGRLALESLSLHKLPWNTRVYTLTAYPRNSEFLIPAKGPRFTLANGQPGLHWRYHTALLLVVPQADSYFPIVLDLFLGGTSPMSLDQWLTHFSHQTVFSAVPFERDQATEDALKTPQRIEGNDIWVNDKKYEPSSVVK